MSTEHKTDDFSGVVNRIEKMRWTLLGIAFFLVILYFFAGWKFDWPRGGPDAWGQFGDYIGGLMNPAIAATALLALIVSIRIQRRELEETRSVLAGQNEIAMAQRAEQRFFDLFKLYQETVGSITIQTRGDLGEIFNGKAALHILIVYYGRTGGILGLAVDNRLPAVVQYLGTPQLPVGVDPAKQLEQWSFALDHYFRVLFTIVREAEPLLGSDHFRYVKFLRAQLSRDETTLLALNMMYDEEGKKLQRYASMYGLLKHLPHGAVRDYAENQFPPQVFGRNFANKRAAEAEVTKASSNEEETT